MMFKNRSVNVHQFAMVPRADIPRAAFNIQTTHKTTFDAGYLIPIFCEEVLPGDTFQVDMTVFARLATPLFPIMDNIHLDSFFFYVPNRLTWNNWVKFMGEQTDPGDSTDYLIPQVESDVGGFPELSIYDYFGIPTTGQTSASDDVEINALPFRAYNLIYNEWFRDQNLIDSIPVLKTDGPDPVTNYELRRRGKRHDYFTSALPWPQKGDAVSLPLGTTAPVIPSGVGSNIPLFRTTGDGVASRALQMPSGTDDVFISGATFGVNQSIAWDPAAGATRLVADLSEATAATINQLRQAFQIQKLLERDARGGTRYTEIIRAHFGVISPDARLQRPEYLGGGSSPVTITPIAQQTQTGLTGGDTPLGTLGAIGTSVINRHGFRQSFTEHGYIIGIISARADLTYQQGLRKMWKRRTRYDFYFPAFAMLGEQAVLQEEIFATGILAQDTIVFGYQERWAEYRYSPPKITGLFKSYATGTIDPWHLAQYFETPPTLSQSFISEQPPIERILAVGAEADGQQFIADFFFNMRVARPMPLFSVPGLIDHF